MKRAHPATTLEEVDQLLDAYTAGGPAAPSAQDTVAQARAVLLEHIPDMRYIAHSVRVLSRLASATGLCPTHMSQARVCLCLCHHNALCR